MYAIELLNVNSRRIPLLMEPYSLEEYEERLRVVKDTAVVKAWLEGNCNMSTTDDRTQVDEVVK